MENGGYKKVETKITSELKEVVIGKDRPTVLIGERINPSGKKKLTESLLAGNLDIVRSEAIAQVKAGADIIDVNVGAFGVDEVAILPQAVRAVMDAVDVPLCIDSAKPEALAAALKIYKGKPLINSVSGEERSLKAVLPLVKEYGAAVIGLLQDDDGIPKNIERRVEIARRIIDRAAQIGIPREDVVIDCLTIAVGAEPNSGLIVIDTIKRVSAEWGINLTLGASNVSFGLPDRNVLNHAFVAIAIASGATSLIVDVAKVRSAILAADLLLAKDKRARRYIEAFRSRESQN
jgi:5-methyltetrahydrofolate--homocysteine methyltransferase